MSGLDWRRILEDLDARGFATAEGVLSPDECEKIAALYDEPERFRSRVVMRRHAYGEGEYQYLAYPLPDPVQKLRSAAYPHLAPMANTWAERMGWAERFPARHEEWLAACADAGQTRPTPLILRYEAGGYNRLHQDLYGDLWFPIQMAVMLSDPSEYEGGDFLLTEGRARMQSRGESVRLQQGEAIIFAVNQRPVPSARGYSRATMRHGVSTLRSGKRMTLGVIFHDAR